MNGLEELYEKTISTYACRTYGSIHVKSYAIYVTRGKLASITPAVDYLFHNAVTARTLADADRSYDRAEPGGNSGESSEPTDTSAELSEP